MEATGQKMDNTTSEQKQDEDDNTMTMVDVLEQEKELEEEYAAVLGASDEKCCTFVNGAMSRQALYSCLTCCPEARTNLDKCAGICLACSYRCHEHHELIELYTKRNFRCDCPTQRFGEQHRCVLNPTLDRLQPRNSTNLYNQNFQGIYCNCRRPYPDPERDDEEMMIQCAICEDWFHLSHLDVPPSSEKLAESATEVICVGCMEKHDFLRDYTELALNGPENADDSSVNITVESDDDDNKLRSDLDKSISEIMGGGEEKTEALAAASDEPAVKRIKIDDNNIPTSIDDTPSVSKEVVNETVAAPNMQCKRQSTANSNYKNGATFWGCDWREALCRCSECKLMYKTQKVEFLLDTGDSAKAYEERGMQRAASDSSYERGIRALASIDRVQQIEAITEYNVMKNKLLEYLQTFVVNKQVVTEEDINRFFAQMRTEKNAELGRPHFLR